MPSSNSKLRARTIGMPWGQLRVWEGGRGEPLLAVHGLGGSGRYWQGLASAVGDRYRVIAPDLPGFGSSDKPQVEYTRSLHLEALHAATEGVEQPLAVCCHSIGGVLGVLWAIDNPQRISGMALAATPFPSPGPRMFSEGGYQPGRAAKVVGATFRMAWPVLALPVALARAYPHAVVRDFGRQSIKGRTGTLWSLLYDPEVRSLVNRASSLSAPVKLIHAEDDRTVGIGAQDHWRELLPQASYERIEEGGHQFLLASDFQPLTRWLNGAAS